MPNQDLIDRVKAVTGQNVAYCPEDQCIYYSPNRSVNRKLKPSTICHSNLKELMQCVKKFKQNHAEMPLKIIRV
jgi:hypothetical protein